MWKRLIDSLPDIGVFAFLGVLAGILRTLFIPGARTAQSYITTFIVCVPISILSGGFAAERGLGDFGAMAVAVLISLAGQGIIEIALDSRKYVSQVIENLIQKYTGK